MGDGVCQAQGGASVWIPVDTGGMVSMAVIGEDGAGSGIGLVMIVIYFGRILFFSFRNFALRDSVDTPLMYRPREQRVKYLVPRYLTIPSIDSYFYHRARRLALDRRSRVSRHQTAVKIKAISATDQCQPSLPRLFRVGLI